MVTVLPEGCGGEAGNSGVARMSEKNGGSLPAGTVYGDKLDEKETLHIGVMKYDIEMSVAHLIKRQRESEVAKR